MIERWSWLGESLGIDFANTIRRRGLEYVEYLDSPRALAEWARREELPLGARDVGSRLAEVRALRDAVFALLLDAARGAGVTPPGAALPPDAASPRDPTSPPSAEARLNAALARVPLVPQLRDGDVVLTAPRDAPALDVLLARVAASVLDMLRDPALSFCDAPSCGQFFLRHRSDQRWCDPSCGTRARVARHAAHHR
jgi:predicted RNA-binding Zn ribbon-like protein